MRVGLFTFAVEFVEPGDKGGGDKPERGEIRALDTDLQVIL